MVYNSLPFSNCYMVYNSHSFSNCYVVYDFHSFSSCYMVHDFHPFKDKEAETEMIPLLCTLIKMLVLLEVAYYVETYD